MSCSDGWNFTNHFRANNIQDGDAAWLHDFYPDFYRSRNDIFIFISNIKMIWIVKLYLWTYWDEIKSTFERHWSRIKESIPASVNNNFNLRNITCTRYTFVKINPCTVREITRYKTSLKQTNKHWFCSIF